MKRVSSLPVRISAALLGVALVALAACDEKKSTSTSAAPSSTTNDGGPRVPATESVRPPPPPAVPPPLSTGTLPRVLGVEGDAHLELGAPLPAASPLVLEKGGKVTLRDSRSGLEFRLEGPLRAYLSEGRVSIVAGTFESLTAPAGAQEFWVATPYGAVRTTGRIRISLEERTHKYEAKDGKAWVFRSTGGGVFRPLEPSVVDHAELDTEERSARLCVDLDKKAKALGDELQGAPKLDPKKSEAQLEARRLAMGACETARARLLISTDPKAKGLYADIETRSPIR